MKKIILINIIIFILLTIPSTAQIGNEIRSYVDSTEIMVINGRKLLIEKLTKKEDEKVKEIYQYLKDFTQDKSNTPFDYTEYLYLNLLMGDWNTLMAHLMEYRKSLDKSPYATNDPLKQFLIKRVIDSGDSLLLESQNSTIDQETKSVIRLLLHLTKNDSPDPEYYRLLKTYQKEYKKSAYKDFIRGYLPGSKIKTAMAFSGGSGIIIPTGKFADNFSPNASLNFSLDVNIHKFYTSLYIHGAGLHLKTPFSTVSGTHTTTYKKKETFDYFEGGFKTGYFFVRSNKFHLAPYMSILGATLKSSRFESMYADDLEYEALNSFSYGPGMHAEIKLKHCNNIDMFGNRSINYLSLKFDAGYNFITKFKVKSFEGNTYYFSVAIAYALGTF